MFAAGLARIGCAATEILAGRADVALGHATSGPALQQNLVCVLRSAAMEGVKYEAARSCSRHRPDAAQE